METENKISKVLYAIMIILLLVLLVLLTMIVVGANKRSTSIEEKPREKGMCVAMESEETYCINGYLYKKNHKFNNGNKSSFGVYEVDDRPYIPLGGICECPKSNPIDTKLIKELTTSKEALNKCEADLNIATQLAEYDVYMLQKQVEELKSVCAKPAEEEKLETTSTVEKVKSEPIKELKEEVKSGNTKDSKVKQSKKDTKNKR